ncbi:MAG: DUF4230 domain-containing protein [Leptolyngbya sp.]|nr:MAG: DUF4230 domain-containing protein [Leptolyngbya sp.]
MSQNDYRSHRNSSWFNVFLWMLSGGALTAALLIGVSQWQWGDRLLAAFNTLLNPPQPAPKVDVRSIMVQKVREASELTTASFTMQAVVPTEQDATVSGFTIGTTKLLYVAYGEVQAGVDLSQLTQQSVQTSGDTIQIQLPPPKILNSKIDVNKSQVYDYNRGFLGLGPDVAPDLQTKAQQEALQKIVQAACEEGILQKASDRAKFVVTQLLNTAGYKAVTVEALPILASACSAAIQSSTQPSESISPNPIAPNNLQPINPQPSVFPSP